MGIGKALKEIRKMQGYLAKDFAKKINISYTTYSNYENDNREPDIENLKKISKGLNIKIDFLINLADSLNEMEGLSLDQSYLLTKNHIMKSQIIMGHFEKLNDLGADKAIDHVEILTKVPEYTK